MEAPAKGAEVRSAFLAAGARQQEPEQLLADGETYTEWKSSKNALVKMIAGFICFVMAVCMLWLNEGHAVRMNELFTLAKRRMKVVKEGATDASNLREFVFTAGKTATEDSLELKDWACLKAPKGSAKLRAQVWMYQWTEKEKSSDNRTTYSYSTSWQSYQVDSSGFHFKEGHENPTCPQPFQSMDTAAASLGSFTLSKRMLGQLQAYKPCEVSGFLTELGAISTLSSYKTPELAQHEGKPKVFFSLSESGGSSGSPAVGDVMVSFEYVLCGPTSIMGVQVPFERVVAPWTVVPLQYVSHHSFKPTFSRAATATTNVGDSKHQTLLGEDEADVYVEEDRNPVSRFLRGVAAFVSGFPNPLAMADKFMTAACPDSLLVVIEEEVTPSVALAKEKAFETKLQWTMRLFGFMLMYVSAESIFSPMKLFLSYIWIIGSILNLGIHILALLCACTCSACTTATACASYRPLYSFMLFAWVAILWFLLSNMNGGPAGH